jgi:hypothetical protein
MVYDEAVLVLVGAGIKPSGRSARARLQDGYSRR